MWNYFIILQLASKYTNNRDKMQKELNIFVKYR
jgi:hypothetical protein